MPKGLKFSDIQELRYDGPHELDRIIYEEAAQKEKLLALALDRMLGKGAWTYETLGCRCGMESCVGSGFETYMLDLRPILRVFAPQMRRTTQGIVIGIQYTMIEVIE